jgi:hypothetical protein
MDYILLNVFFPGLIKNLIGLPMAKNKNTGLLFK